MVVAAGFAGRGALCSFGDFLRVLDSTALAFLAATFGTFCFLRGGYWLRDSYFFFCFLFRFEVCNMVGRCSALGCVSFWNNISTSQQRDVLSLLKEL